ncbi:SigmaK-factor processing regulatory BofA [Acididesulfobacillus acetoxydans]|uniref:SigmaK-factor processing regulatory BofA n=1 Tax=Acididesulfobacillus acetoxydans TaxID=1561005 RepID=A0A8S0W6H8_9FIRM|nr:pro-sigmaK processing inhibitor BofA family protein [Acididesulfobacillus acetoxydans]CAA7599859.1 SigmaK-factor processing regulatory BofA [Acididesulfobacillus acetoxydans]CEJ07425.1 SigmaK-factor processing regulatory protein BofA [Acididesulfobacillus acetoxydans]
MTLVFLGLFIVLLVLIGRSALKKPGLILRLAIHVLGGIVGLWLFDILLSLVGFEIPINPFTIVLVGFLGFPGVLALSALQIFKV